MSDMHGLSAADERPVTTRARPLVLLVDDDAIERLVGREYFEAAGFDVLDLASGRDCIEQVPIVRPDLIILM